MKKFRLKVRSPEGKVGFKRRNILQNSAKVELLDCEPLFCHERGSIFAKKSKNQDVFSLYANFLSFINKCNLA